MSGDNYYEGNGGWRVGDGPIARQIEDMVPKFWMLGWSFRELLADRPSLFVTDDHDVFSNDLWGGISFAVIEDRKWKSAPYDILDVPVGHDRIHVPENVRYLDPPFDPTLLDSEDLQLLGPRQLAFLEGWAADWRGVDFKVVLSGSPWCMPFGGEGYADMDSNGWPQSGRHRALETIRKGAAIAIHGDLHTASLVHQGLDDWNDAAWVFTTPAGAPVTRRRWERTGGMNREPGMSSEGGEYFDSFGNRITLWAVANPGWPKTVALDENDGRKPAGWLPMLRFGADARPVVQVFHEHDEEIVYTRRIAGTSFRPPVFEAGLYGVRVWLSESGEPPLVLRNLRALRHGPVPSIPLNP